MNFNVIFKGAQIVTNAFVKALPNILTAVSAVGTVATAVSSGHDTLKAKAIIDHAEEEGLTKKEIALDVAKCYIPTAATVVLSVGSGIWSNRIYAGRLAGMQAMAIAAEQAAGSYKKFIAQELGEKAIEEAKDAMYGKAAEDEIAKNGLPPEDEGDIYGNTLFFDPVKNKFFRYNIEDLRQHENEINFKLMDLYLSGRFMTLNDIYEEVGMELLPPEIGSELGWAGSDGPIEFNHRVMKTKNDVPYFVWEFTEKIHPRFYEFGVRECD